MIKPIKKCRNSLGMYEYIVFYFKFRVLDFNIQIFLQVFCEFVGGGGDKTLEEC